jgi:hypothetical protein
VSERAPAGRLSVSPDCGVVGEWGAWTVRFTAGPGGLPTGGAIRVALPPSWHQWHRNSARALQATHPAEPFYVAARATRPGVDLRCEVEGEAPLAPAPDETFVKRPRPSLDGKDRRYGWVVRVGVAAGALEEGDAIDVVYGDGSGGSRGFTPPLWGASPEVVRAEVDAAGGGDFRALPAAQLPTLRVLPGPATEVVVLLPSSSVAGEPAEALITCLDANLNPAWPAGLTVSLRAVEGEVDLAQETVACPPDAWSVRVPFTPRAAGLIRLRGQSADGRLFAVSNPSRCAAERPAERPAERLLWGDLHGHTQLSWDATGLPEDAFRYARDVSGLQVYGNADHGESLSAADWEETVQRNARYYQPGKFVTLVGYEDSLGFPFGHHNVFFRGASGPLRHSRDMSLTDLWAATEPGTAVTIPHHTVALGNPSRPNTNWAVRDDRFRPVAEIYSGHGQSELHADDSPLASDVVDFTLTGPGAAPGAVREAWLLGHPLGVIASSDNHCARPGRDGFGVMAVYATAATREAVFDAIRRRRTYGTTGCRLLLDFAVNGTPMGGEHRLARGGALRLSGEIVGTAPLRFVEIMKADLAAGAWRVAHRMWFAGGAPSSVTLDWTDPEPAQQGIYYLRVRQREIVHGRVAMAWSSPVWVVPA